MERRGIWSTIAGVLAAGGVAFLVPGLLARLPIVIAVGVALLLGALLLFTSLLWGWPSAALSTLGSSQPGGSTDSGDELPDFPTVTVPTGIRQIYRLNPSSWLGRLGPEPPDISLRVAVEFPGPPSARWSEEIATKLRGQAREEWLTQALESSPFTTWLRELRSEWHWNSSEIAWEIRGNGNPEYTELVWAPQWEGYAKQPFVARCGVLTGWMPLPDGTFRPAVRLALDILLTTLELGPGRRPGAIRHTTTPMPAPAALTLRELATCMVHLFAVPTLAEQAGTILLGADELRAGDVGAWMELSGVHLERVVDLSGLRRITDALGVGDHSRVGSWPLEGNSRNGASVDTFVADFMDELLERAGYRDVQNYFDWLRANVPDQ